MPGAATCSTTKSSSPQQHAQRVLRRNASLFPREKGFYFGQLGTISARRTNRSELSVERLCHGGVSGSLGSARGAKERIEAIGGILDVRLVFNKRFGGTLAFREHVREHFTCGDADRLAAVLVLMIRGGAQFLQSFVGLSFGEGQPGFRFAEVGGLLIRSGIASLARALLAFGNEL